MLKFSQSKRRNRKEGGFFISIMLIAVCFVVNVYAAVNEDAFAVYTESATTVSLQNPVIKFWNATFSNTTQQGEWSAALELPAAGSPIREFVLRASPISTKLVLVTQSDDGNLDAYVCNSNCKQSEFWQVTNNIGNVWSSAPATHSRSYDVAFESASGDANIIFAIVNTSTDCDLASIVLPASAYNFTPLLSTCIDDTTSSADIQYSWVAAARDPVTTSDEIIIVGFDSTNNNVSAWVWNGDGWGNQNKLSHDSSATSGNEALAVAYAADGSIGMVAAGEGTVGNVSVIQWGGSSWTDTADFDADNGAGSADDVRWLRLKPDPATDDLQAMFIDNEVDIGTAYWSGASWTVKPNLDEAVDSATTRVADFEWNATGSLGILVVDTDTTGTTLNVTECNPQCTKKTSTYPAFGATGAWVTLVGSYNSSDKLNILGTRMNSDFHIGAMYWNSTNLTNYNNATLTANTSVSTFERVSLDFKRNDTSFPPVVSNVVLNATSDGNLTTDNLTFYFDAVNKDGDDLANSTDWRLEGKSIALFYFPFDVKNTTGEVIDMSTNGNNGTINPGAQWNRTGIIGGAYSIPGTTDNVGGGSITVPDQNKFDQAPLTVSMWVKFHRLPTQNPIVEDMSIVDHSHSVSPFASWGISGRNADNTLVYFVYNFSGDVAGTVTTADAVVIEEWMHVALIINESNYTFAYKNGTNIGGFDAVNILNADSTIFIGSIASSAFQVLNGTVDEVILFNRSLSDEQILEIYHAGLTGNATTILVDSETTLGDNWTAAAIACDLKTCATAVSPNLEIIQASANAAPVVEAIDGPGGNSISAQSVTEDGITDLLVTFTVTDTNGVADIDMASANITLYNTTYISTDANYYSYNTSCNNNENITANQANFTCAVEISYWYGSGEWNLTAGAADFSNAAAENATNVTIQETTAIVISPNSLTFPSLTLGAENITADTDPITINNTANDYIDENNTRVTGLDLVGEVNPEAQAITAENFTVSDSTGGTPPLECSFIDINTTRLVNNTATPVNASILNAGNRSVAGQGVEELYFCVPLVPDSLLPQAYSTLNSTAGWTVSVV